MCILVNFIKKTIITRNANILFNLALKFDDVSTKELQLQEDFVPLNPYWCSARTLLRTSVPQTLCFEPRGEFLDSHLVDCSEKIAILISIYHHYKHTVNMLLHDKTD